jgi:hypothetical protein
MYIEYLEQRTCKKCGKEKEITDFCDMINLNKSYDCKDCRNNYTKAYYLANKEKIRANERVRRNRAKKNNNK